MIKQAIASLADGCDLTEDMARGAMEEIMSGTATPSQIAGYLTALRMKGETVEEITAGAKVMREKALLLPDADDAMDIVGTGGDCAFTFNISTISSIVAAAAGVKIAKHGNRSVSSKCGAADLLDALGVNIGLSPEQNAKVLEKTGMCFMFAQVHHKSMKYAAATRKELGIRTLFNILGPLSNPAKARYQILGVYDISLTQPLARVLDNLGVTRAMVVCGGTDGKSIDEISLCGKTEVCELNCSRISRYMLDADNFGLKPCRLSDISGADAEGNAVIARKILSGEKGPKRDTVIANTAAALYIAGKGNGLKQCAAIAAETIDSGKAAEKLEEFIKASNEF